MLGFLSSSKNLTLTAALALDQTVETHPPLHHPELIRLLMNPLNGPTTRICLPRISICKI